ncbi:MAG TPA: glycoside hydrolase family 18 protein [Vicinamibacterales bacterium]|nr:glycoside hydrolase family 18 protein [Vicinamibacterales bacterium]
MTTITALVAMLIGLLQSGGLGQTTGSPRKIVGYYADWTAERYPLADIPADKLTHVNYAFGKIDADHKLTFNRANALDRVYPGDCSQPECKHGLFNQVTLIKQRYPDVKFILSVGGWTDSGPFYEMAASEETRQTFARSCAEFLNTYPQFDGIDIDWEHPVAGGLQPGQPRDARNYVLLLSALRTAIGTSKLLTVAVGAGPRAIEPLEYAEMAPLLDWVNVMTYDFHSGGTRAGFNSALYNHDDPSNPRLNSHDAVQAILTKGVPRTKLVVGVPFYGRGWRGIESPAPWIEAAGTIQVGGYRAIAANQLQSSTFVRHWDDVAKVPWLYSAERKEWITYEDAQSMRIKGQYVVEQGLAGAMFWELSNDDGTLLDALRAGLTMKNSPASQQRQ